MTLPQDAPPPIASAPSTRRLERRQRLRQFQENLAERMQAARAETGANENRLGIVIGQTRWLLDLSEVGEIVPVTTITKVPLAKDWYLGLLNIRGNLIGVIDFSRFLELDPTQVENAGRVVTFSPSLGINCGLLVTRVMGLRNIAQMKPESDSSDIAGDWVGQRYRDQESLDWISLKLSSIVQNQRFLHIGL